MQRTIAVTAATGALLFGGAVVNPPAPTAAAPSSTTTTLADTHHSDKDGLWLVGLVGLLGLAGLARRRNEPNVGAGTAAPNYSRPSPNGLVHLIRSQSGGGRTVARQPGRFGRRIDPTV